MTCILIVDDSPVIRRIINVMLKQSGFSVLMASDGYAALEFLAENKVDLALVDIEMPRMNGLVLLEEIRRSEKFGTLPVVMLTSSSEEQDLVEAEEKGANGFLNKPAGARELFALINDLTMPEGAS